MIATASSPTPSAHDDGGDKVTKVDGAIGDIERKGTMIVRRVKRDS